MPTLLQVVIGALALTVLSSGTVAMATKKGGALHVMAGRTFHAAVLATALVVVPLAFWTGSVFLVLVSGMCAYLVHSGRREILRQRSGEPPGRSDHLAVGLVALGGAVLLVWAAWVAWTEGLHLFVWITGGFGLLLLHLARKERQRLTRAPEHEHAWLTQHIGAMGSTWAAAWVGFGFAYYGAIPLPGWLIWLGPFAIGVPLVLRFLVQAKAKGRDATLL